MVVNDIEECGEALHVAGIHQPLEALGAAVTMLGCKGMHPVIPPIACPGELSHRHDFNRCDA